jgi:hypothetical protein
MDARDSKFVIKIMPSLADLVFLTPIVFLFARMDGVKTLLGDCDTGWHIRAGEWIIANGRVPTTDLFSFSKPNQPWYAWEWLSEVIWAWLHAHGGLAAVVLFSIALLAVTFTVLFRLTCRDANPVVAAVLTMIAAVTSSIHWLARPHLFSLLFLALFCGALARIRSGEDRLWRVPYFILLPAATVLWTNLHGGFFVGVVMIAVYGLGESVRGALSAAGDILGLPPPAWPRASSTPIPTSCIYIYSNTSGTRSPNNTSLNSGLLISTIRLRFSLNFCCLPEWRRRFSDSRNVVLSNPSQYCCGRMERSSPAGTRRFSES